MGKVPIVKTEEIKRLTRESVTITYISDYQIIAITADGKIVRICDFCREVVERFLIIPDGCYFAGVVVCQKCLDGALNWLEQFWVVAMALSGLKDDN